MTDDHAAIHQVSYFLGALAHACENNLGRSSLSLSVLAGKKFGKEAVQAAEQTSDPFKAVDILRNALTARGIFWDFAPFEGDRGVIIEEDGKKKIRLAFHTCMVRNALFCYAHEQKQSLCYMAHGVFAGAMERVMPNATVHLEILHAGPNACLKELIWEEAK
ncbi:MAG: hypothetical protein MUE60_00465 [Candidatus Eisenbacteria bacterium]|nr:hypothetical protein [Candidatus Eisenbacteria bacterium]